MLQNQHNQFTLNYMSLTAEDLQTLEKINNIFARIENEAEEAGMTPDEYLAPTKKYLVGGVAYFEKELPFVGTERSSLFTKATGVNTNTNTNQNVAK